MESTIAPPLLSARTRLLASASRLFHEHGINATGIDLVVRDAGVAKASLYNNFAGKEALVVAYLEQELGGWVRNVHALDYPLAPPRQRVAALFEALALSVESNRFYGCPFTNAVIELPECVSVRTVAERYRAVVRAHIADITGEDAASTTVSRLVLLYDAAITAAKVGRDAALVREASTMAQELV
ncbi:TetR/AcrR family transcriptional regulator [Cryobacterium algoritolerans]|uniref:TetR/AcrR family transcriptional regulator n=1 Tax=Cryobacterium algoritolerans TaxID=1259184 RepID=A0A4R8WVR2_9MICO|nr:TetR/AcrR family transcriptional regulator [Cryobacterium algoritolerans]TFC18935.1 TetR/AcrR family transcriptional regulator [Cryobacterium algoritolerans]